MSIYTVHFAKLTLSNKLRWLDKLDAEKWVRIRRYVERRFEKTFGHPMPEIKTNVGSKISETLADHLLNSIYISTTSGKNEKPEKPEQTAKYFRVYSEVQMAAFLDFATRVRNRYTGDERRRKKALARKTIELSTKGAAALNSLAKKLNASHSLVVETALLDADEEFKKQREELKKGNKAKRDTEKKIAELTEQLANLEAQLKLKQMTIASQRQEIDRLVHTLGLSAEERQDSLSESTLLEELDVTIDALAVKEDASEEIVDSSEYQGDNDDDQFSSSAIKDEDGDKYRLDGRRGRALENNISDVKQTNRHRKGIGN